ncbi:hypothetical protein [Stenotrophomonas muris]|uniref:hypothetical protein n=1 Tax=Stenotrophomonas muris TaxID=2963283 RepID=UPI0039C62A8B
MTTDNKTLADVQPGGRVRLDNVRDRVMGECEQWFDTSDVDMEAATDSIIAAAQPSPGAQAAHCPVKHCGMTYARVPADGRCHACGAPVQPSPGGQGDARRKWLEVRGLAEGIVKNLRAFADSPNQAAWCGALDDSLSFAETIEKDADAAYSAGLAARQPVTMDDALAAGDGTLHGAIDHWQERALRAEAELAARQPVGEPVCADCGTQVLFECTGCSRSNYPTYMQGAIGEIVYSGEGGLQIEFYDGKPLAPMKLYAAPPAQAVDLGPSRSVLAEVAKERARQEAKWGQQNHVDWTPTSAATDLAGAWPAGVGDHFKFITDYKAKGAEGHRLGYFDILMEEVAEAHDEARDGNTKATRAELVQVAAVAVAWIECIDRRMAVADSQAVGK